MQAIVLYVTLFVKWYKLKGCVQQARKWLFRPKFFSSSKWAQFLHVTLDLTGKRCPVIFSAVLFFVFEKFSSTSTGGKCALRWFYCLEKQKFSLEKTPPGKKLRFCIRYLWKMKEKPANLNGGLCFSIKWKATCRNWAHLDEEKNFGLKSHLRACCTQPFNYTQRTRSAPSLLWRRNPPNTSPNSICVPYFSFSLYCILDFCSSRDFNLADLRSTELFLL